MSVGKLNNLWHRERLGLTMIVASILVIGVTIVLLLDFQSDTRIENLRRQGAAISRILADVPIDELTARNEQYGPLRMLQLGQDEDEFAYAIVVGQTGEILNGVSAPSIQIEGINRDVAQGSWSGERKTYLPGSNREALEFFSPIVEGGDVLGTVRVGYYAPTLGLTSEQVPFIATMALTIFLLTPLFYFSVRRETRPIKVANEEIASRIDEGQISSCTVEASGELKEFIERFNKFTELARSRIEHLEHDNDELVASQKLLSYRKLRIEAVLQAIPEAILILGEDGSVSYASEKITELLGVEPQEILRKRPSEWCMHEEALNFLRRFEKTSTANFYTETVRFSRSDLLDKRISIKAYPLFSPQNPEAVFGRLVVLRDVTKEALAEEGRANFVAHVSHELKAPLHTLGLYAEALQGDTGQEEEFRIEAYNVIHDEVERLRSLVENLLSITKIEIGNLKIDKQRVRLQDLLRDAFNHVSASGRDKKLKFEMDLPPELTAVAVDKDLLRIAINNLLVNAIKYTPAGGRISMSATETDSAIEIRVADNGIGISPEDQDKIFDKFYRAESEEVRKIGGHGLGLPLAREIIELHRGQLSVSSERGKGSEFVACLWKDTGLVKQAI
ncbi:MAG: PAS domain-containing protein [Gammaproteobacteria bacterium]|nr:PAS domain-containing protein [Gammaproteobacteria bacterium]